jgi:signal transduction histidine kinase
VRPGVVAHTAIASVLIALVVGAAFTILLREIDSLRASERAVAQSREESAIAGDLEQRVIDLETGVRGFALTGQERFLEPWQKARTAIPAQTKRLAALSTSPDQVRQVGELTRDIDSYVEDYSAPLVAAVRSNRAAGLRLATNVEGKRRIDALRAEFARLRAAEQARLTPRLQQDDQDASHAATVATVALGISIVLIVLFGGYLMRAIAVPLRGAAAMAGRLAGGDLAVRLPERGIGEVSALERAFNSMAGSVQSSRDKLHRLADEQAALRRVATLVAEEASTAEVFQAVTREVGLQCDADLARMERFESERMVTAIAAWSRGGEPELAVGRRFALVGSSIAGLVLDTGSPARVDTFVGASGPIAREAQELGIRSSVGCPIVVGARTWGVIAASRTHGAPFPPNTESRIADFTALVATAVSNTEARADVLASRTRLLTAGDDARRRVVRDLHDGAQQRLVHTIITLKLAQRAYERDHEAAAGLVGEALGEAQQANAELRELAHGILPSVLARGGLAAGVDALVSRLRVPVEVAVPAERLPREIEASAYFVVAEALTNVAKHSGAQSADVRAWVGDRVLHVDVRDDGIGGARPEGSGLVGLRDRVAALGGRLRIESPPGDGTRIAATLPLPLPGGTIPRG